MYMKYLMTAGNQYDKIQTAQEASILMIDIWLKHNLGTFLVVVFLNLELCSTWNMFRVYL